MHASGATAGVVVLATCIVLKGYEKGLLCWGLHVIPLPHFEFVPGITIAASSHSALVPFVFLLLLFRIITTRLLEYSLLSKHVILGG